MIILRDVDGKIITKVKGDTLSHVCLNYSNFNRAVLQQMNLVGAELTRSSLRAASCYETDFRGASCSGADFTNADLRKANFTGANCTDANFTGAILTGTDFLGAKLSGAKFDLEGLKKCLCFEDLYNSTRILPEGDLIGWKRCRNNILAKLLIPKEAKRSHAFGRKCRAEYAEVLELVSLTGKMTPTFAHSKFDPYFQYKVGDTVRPINQFDENWVDECASGIHFFITRREAELYN